jgi:hypothetical protein
MLIACCDGDLDTIRALAGAGVPLGDGPRGCQHFWLEDRQVGRCTLTPPDPQLKGAWFQPLHLSSENPVSKFAFQIQLAPLQPGWGASGASPAGERVPNLRGGGGGASGSYQVAHPTRFVRGVASAGHVYEPPGSTDLLHLHPPDDRADVLRQVR